MYTIRKVFKFEGAHVLSSSYSKECQRIHGHSYKVEVFISNGELNSNGMVIDFKKLKEIVSPLINEFDHKMLVHNQTFVPEIMNSMELTGIKIVNFNPTAENMCVWFYDNIKIALKEMIWCNFKLAVRIHETDTGYAEYYE